MGIAAGADLKHFMNALRSPESAWYAGKRFARHDVHLLSKGRGLHLVNGNALAARLLKSAVERGVRLENKAEVRSLVVAHAAVVGADLDKDGKPVRVSARRGVVLACGGFPHDVVRRQQLFPHAPTGKEHWSAAPPTNTGDGLRLAEQVGAAIDTTLRHPAAWAPVSEVPRRDGKIGIFPHLIDRARPGVIAVRSLKRRSPTTTATHAVARTRRSAAGRPFNRAGGDSEVKPNPCVAPIEKGPFYGIKILPGSLGTFAGIKTDANARALRPDGTPIPGLYAVGSDMASVMGGCYPAGGITLGPAMTFGFIAGRHLANAKTDSPTPIEPALLRNS